MAQILPEFLEKHPQVDFHFVGKANPQETLQVQEFVRLYPGRVRWYSLPPEQMQTAYQEADIALIPTLHSEGTSLSCLEALASGNVVIATNVGGLPDLVIDGFNGLLIEPEAEPLRAALEQAVSDAGLRERLRRNAIEVAQAFDIERWRSRWIRLLQERLTGVAAGRPGGGAGRKIRCALFPAAPGFSWLEAGERFQNLANALASLGVDTYVYHTARLAAAGHLHILAGDKDELFLTHPAVIITHPGQYAEISRYPDPFVVYDVPPQFDTPGGAPPEDKDLAAHLMLLSQADLLLVSAQTLAQKLEQQGMPFVFAPAGSNTADFVAAFRSQKGFQESLNE